MNEQPTAGNGGLLLLGSSVGVAETRSAPSMDRDAPPSDAMIELADLTASPPPSAPPTRCDEQVAGVEWSPITTIETEDTET